MSLGANVSLHAAVLAPERVAALLVEMPVLEWATPAAATLFVPLLLAVSYGRRLFGFAASLIRRLPRSGIDALDSLLGTFSTEPEAIAAVLHGILVGPVAPEIEERRAITAPTLIIGHENDLIHPFSDAENLAQ
jgi:pimeloyl-ACP methyl ester carboxylesterase